MVALSVQVLMDRAITEDSRATIKIFWLAKTYGVSQVTVVFLEGKRMQGL